MKKQIKGIENYSNKWIALNENKSEVMFSSDTYTDLLKTLKKTKDKVFLMKLPPFVGSYAP